MDSSAIAKQVAAAIGEFLRRNAPLIEPDDDWSIIAFVTPGLASGGSPTVCVHGYPLPFHSWAKFFDDGVPVVISEFRQVPPNCWPSELKSRSRMHFYLADRAATAARPGARAILLDQEGYVAESTTANVFVFKRDEGLISPPPDHILSGVSLGVVRELAATSGIPFIVRRLAVSEFTSADEAMLTSTSICVLPIVECDGRGIGAGRPGPIYRQLLAAWGDLVGVDIAQQARRFAERPA